MKALFDVDDFDLEEVTVLAASDWTLDAREIGFDPDSAHVEAAQEMVFGIADLWCPGITGTEYASFLRKLHNRITVDFWDKELQAWVRPWRTVDTVTGMDDGDGGGAGGGLKAAWQFEEGGTGSNVWDNYRSQVPYYYYQPVSTVINSGTRPFCHTDCRSKAASAAIEEAAAAGRRYVRIVGQDGRRKVVDVQGRVEIDLQSQTRTRIRRCALEWQHQEAAAQAAGEGGEWLTYHDKTSAALEHALLDGQEQLIIGAEVPHSFAF
jgi:hypothetical protein